MSTKAELQALLERVKAATGPDRELDAHIFACSQGGRIHYFDAETKEFVWEKPMGGFWARGVKSVRSTAKFTTSVDAIKAMVERDLPGWRICIETKDGIAVDCYLVGPDYDDSRPEVSASEPFGGMPVALALTAAFLSAMIAQMEAGHAKA